MCKKKLHKLFFTYNYASTIHADLFLYGVLFMFLFCSSARLVKNGTSSWIPYLFCHIAKRVRFATKKELFCHRKGLVLASKRAPFQCEKEPFLTMQAFCLGCVCVISVLRYGIIAAEDSSCTPLTALSLRWRLWVLYRMPSARTACRRCAGCCPSCSTSPGIWRRAAGAPFRLRR